jgi:two-component system NtrC family sensor kinase
LDVNGGLLASRGSGCREAHTRLRATGVDAIRTGRQMAAVSGGWPGLFWPGGSSLVIARPRQSMGENKGALAAELSLTSLFQDLVYSQRLFLVYSLINLLFFAMLGFFRLYRAIVKPIERLVNTAEEFRDEAEFSFPPAARASEFNRLSASLNRMLSRIHRDRARLSETVASLEQANLGLRKAQEDMVRAEKMASVGRLSAGIAHEIGNPIGIILGYLELLRKPGVAEEQHHDFIRRAEGEANRVHTIIRQLLDFSRPAPALHDGPVSVHEVLEEVLELCRIQPLMNTISLDLLAEAGRDLVRAPGDQLKQIFLNLILNAADAINSLPVPDSQGMITIKTGNPGDSETLSIEVSDNGPGFGAEHLAYVFDPFYTTKEPGKGTGLGLSICFTIAENLGGEISAADNPDGGARITLVLPLADRNLAGRRRAEDGSRKPGDRRIVERRVGHGRRKSDQRHRISDGKELVG